MNEGGQIQISARHESATEASLEIRDDGAGVSPEQRLEIFKPYHIKEHHNRYKDDKTYPYKYAFDHFFIGLVEMLEERHLLNEKISIVFDRNTDGQWDSALREVAAIWEKGGLKIGDITYGNKQEYPHWPLQAADMLAYRSRKLTASKLEKQIERNVPVYVDATVYDIMLNRNMRPKIGFTPVITEALAKEITELTGKHAPVRRALMEIPNDYFGLHAKQRKQKL